MFAEAPALARPEVAIDLEGMPRAEAEVMKPVMWYLPSDDEEEIL